MCSLLQSNLVLASSNVARTSRRYVFRGAIAIDRSFENHVVRFACVVRFRDGSFFTRAMGIDMNQARMVNDRFHGRKRFRNMWTIRVRGKTSDWFDVVRGLFVPDDAVKIGLSTSLSKRFIYHRSPPSVLLRVLSWWFYEIFTDFDSSRSFFTLKQIFQDQDLRAVKVS